jgi:hypothetical protein
MEKVPSHSHRHHVVADSPSGIPLRKIDLHRMEVDTVETYCLEIASAAAASVYRSLHILPSHHDVQVHFLPITLQFLPDLATYVFCGEMEKMKPVLLLLPQY